MFTYGPAAVPPTNDGRIDPVRLLVADTDVSVPIFQNEEIEAAYALQASLIPGRNLPISPLRVAALLLDSLATNYGRMQNVVALLDVKLSPRTAKDMQALAQSYRDQDDNAGGFVMVEQTNTAFAFRDRFFAQAQRRGAL